MCLFVLKIDKKIYRYEVKIKICGQSVQSNHEQYPLFPTAHTCLHPPAAPVHGRRYVTGITIGSTVTYSCSTGYTLNGSSRITCMSNRHWSGKAPDCIRKLLFHQMHNYVYQAFGRVHVVHQLYILLFPSDIFL